MSDPVIVREDNLRAKRNGERVYCLTLIHFPYHSGCIFYFPRIRSGTLDRSVETEGQFTGYVNTSIEFNGEFRFEHAATHTVVRLPRLTEEQRREFLEAEGRAPTQLFLDPTELDKLFTQTRAVLFVLMACVAEHPKFLKNLTPTTRLLVERCTPFLDRGYVMPISERLCPTP